MIEKGIVAPCQALMVARSLKDVSKPSYPCRVLNPTEKSIAFKPKTAVGVLAPVNLQPLEMKKVLVNEKSLVIVAEMRATLEAKSISLEDTAVTGNDFDKLIQLLYENINLFATSLKDLPGCGLLKHRIETKINHPLGYAHTGIRRQTRRKYRSR